MAQYFTGIAILISAVLATVGWFVAARYQQILSRRQHTFGVYNSYRTDKEFHKARAHVQQLFAASNIPRAGDPNRAADIKELDWLLNHYEFISGAIVTGDIDERLMKAWEKSRMIKLFQRSWQYIEQDRDLENQSTMYENLQIVCERWGAGRGRLGDRVCEYFTLKPCQKLPWWLGWLNRWE